MFLVSLESAQPLFDPNASLVGDSLFIVVLDGSGIRSQSIYTVGDRGAVQRLDFGAAVLDSDGDGLPDAWERLHLGSTSPTPNSINANGQTTLQNYVAGTNPNDTNSLFRVAVTASGANALFSFQALRAEGTGYEGLSRYYSLEYSTNAGAGLWLGLNNFTRSEEHTSELQSHSDLVCRLLLEKKKRKNKRSAQQQTCAQ